MLLLQQKQDLSSAGGPVRSIGPNLDSQISKGQSILRERSNAGPSCVRAWLGCVLTSTLAPAQAVSRGLVLLAPRCLGGTYPLTM
jgi:hypothetical protein